MQLISGRNKSIISDVRCNGWSSPALHAPNDGANPVSPVQVIPGDMAVSYQSFVDCVDIDIVMQPMDVVHRCAVMYK